mmetsp:Transcript_13121/g.25796  ORF Transcript_13121/g.25796 Transcript_13121/m.25796 type:complete len:134 (+) Transcript_13121:420-821(+)
MRKGADQSQEGRKENKEKEQGWAEEEKGRKRCRVEAEVNRSIETSHIRFFIHPPIHLSGFIQWVGAARAPQQTHAASSTERENGRSRISRIPALFLFFIDPRPSLHVYCASLLLSKLICISVGCFPMFFLIHP